MEKESIADSLAGWLKELVAGRQTSCEIALEKRAVSSKVPHQSLLLSVARPAMACEFEILLNQHQYPSGPDQAMFALDLIESLEAQLSVYRPQSELSKLNQFGAERPVSVSFHTQRLLRLGQAVHAWTQGAFDLTAGTLSEAWGFSRRQGRMPGELEIEQALQYVGSQHLQVIEIPSQAALARPGIKVNPGGIGKGYALDQAADLMIENGILDFMIHGGMSSVIAQGHRTHSRTGGGWLVALKHPFRWEETLGTIRLRNRALGTSGSGKQFFHFGGKRYSHIIDPRTGWPADSTLSATVVCASAAMADALATAFFVMGVDATRDFCTRHREVAAILIHQPAAEGAPQLVTINVTEDMWQSEGRLAETHHQLPATSADHNG